MCGLLVDPSSRPNFITGLADAISRLARDPDLRRTMGNAGRQKVEERYDWEAKLDVMIKVYVQAIIEWSSEKTTPPLS